MVPIIISIIIGLVVIVCFAYLFNFESKKPSITDSGKLKKEENVFQKKDDGVDQSALGSHFEDMKLDLLSGHDIKELKKTYEMVKRAVESIPPKIRDRVTSHPVWKIDLSDSKTQEKDIKQAQKHIMKIIKSDLHVTKLPLKLTRKLESVFNAAKFKRIKEQKEEYCEIELSGDFGGTSHVRIGIIGMQRLEHKEEILMHAALYFEKWVQQTHDKINTSKAVWNKENVKKFAKYLLIEEINGKIKSEKDKMIAIIKKENGTELYEWLESIELQQYYHDFKKNGFEKKRNIAKIDKDTLKNVIKISKHGHVLEFVECIEKLKHEVAQHVYNGEESFNEEGRRGENGHSQLHTQW